MSTAREKKLQELSDRLVRQDVLLCVSTMVYHIQQVCAGFDPKILGPLGIDEDALINLAESNDYEASAVEHVEACDDLEDLACMVETIGDLDDCLHEVGAPESSSIGNWYYTMPEHEQANFDKKVRAWIIKRIDDAKEFCEDNDVDLDEKVEVLEHWVVSSWLAQELAERGETIVELFGMQIWGRCTSGQAVSADGVIQGIAASIWLNELKADDASQGPQAAN